jgi:uncharacterized protein
MFVAVARVSLQIPDSGSLKAKRQILRRVSDRVKARFNVSVAEVDDQDLWQKATLAMAVVSNDRRHANEVMDKILQYVEDMYVAPVIERELEIISLGDRLGGVAAEDGLSLEIPRGERSLAEAEGMEAWEERHAPAAKERPVREKDRPAAARKVERPQSLEEARAKARSLRNPRDWEKK